MRPETVWLLIFLSENRLNGFENGKTRLFNSGGVVKLAYFQKKWSIPLRTVFVGWIEFCPKIRMDGENSMMFRCSGFDD